MAITRTAMIDDDGSGFTGTIFNNAWKTELYNQIDGIGTWVAVPYVAGNFSWVVEAADVKTNRYTVIGKTLIWQLKIADSAVAVSDYLTAKIPAGLLAARDTAQPIQLHDAGAWKIGAVDTAVATPTLVSIRQVNYSAIAVGPVFIDFVLTLEVQ